MTKILFFLLVLLAGAHLIILEVGLLGATALWIISRLSKQGSAMVYANA